MTTKKTKICKFEELLGLNTKGIRQQRISLVRQSTENAMKRYISDKENLLVQKKLELDRILDLAPDTTDSLRPGGENFDPERFVATWMDLEKSIQFLEEVDLKIAKKRYEEYFGIDEEE